MRFVWLVLAGLLLSGATQAQITTTGAGAFGPAASSPAIDGTSNIVIGNGAGSFTLTLSTTKTNDVIVTHILSNLGPVTGITDGAGLSWSARATAAFGTDNVQEWSAKSSAILTNDVITVTVTSGSYNSAIALGVSGTNFASPFDSGGPQHQSGSGTAQPISMTTANANAFVFGACRFGSTATPVAGSGWTGLVSGAPNSFLLSEYQILASAQLVTLTTTTDATACVIDAVHP